MIPETSATGRRAPRSRRDRRPDGPGEEIQAEHGTWTVPDAGGHPDPSVPPRTAERRDDRRRTSPRGSRRPGARMSRASDLAVPAAGGAARRIGRRDVANVRDLFLNLVHADLTSRFHSTALGALWFVLGPTLTTLILVVVFQHVVRLGIPDYPLFVLCAVLPWSFYQAAVQNALASLTRSPALVKRVLIPRAVLPLSAVAASLVHFALSLLVLLGVMLALGRTPSAAVALFPVALGLQLLSLTGLALAGAALNVFYRDVGHVVPVLLRLAFYLTPSFYPLAYVPARWRDLYLLNPMAGVVELYRQALLTGGWPSPRLLAITFGASAAVLAAGIVVFRRCDPYLEDHL
jgi:lipopolysaccharide transport system permease protein